MKKTVLSLLSLIFILNASAQCAMCKAVVESGDAEVAEGLNDGILYLILPVFPSVTIISGIAQLYAVRVSSFGGRTINCAVMNMSLGNMEHNLLLISDNIYRPETPF